MSLRQFSCHCYLVKWRTGPFSNRILLSPMAGRMCYCYLTLSELLRSSNFRGTLFRLRDTCRHFTVPRPEPFVMQGGYWKLGVEALLACLHQILRGTHFFPLFSPPSIKIIVQLQSIKNSSRVSPSTTTTKVARAPRRGRQVKTIEEATRGLKCKS